MGLTEDQIRKQQKKELTSTKVTDRFFKRADVQDIQRRQEEQKQESARRQEEERRQNQWVADTLMVTDEDIAPAEETVFSRQHSSEIQLAAKDKAFRAKEKEAQDKKDETAVAALRRRGTALMNSVSGVGSSMKKREAAKAASTVSRVRQRHIATAQLRQKFKLELDDDQIRALEAKDTQTLKDKEEQTIREDNLDLLNCDDPFLEIRRDTANADIDVVEKSGKKQSKNEKAGLRNDILGDERRKNMQKYKTPGPALEAAVQKDIKNLVKNLELDQILGGKEVEFEEPLLTAVKANTVLNKMSEITIIQKEMKENELKDWIAAMKEMTQKELPHLSLKKLEGYKQQIRDKEKELEILREEKKIFQDFTLKLRPVTPLAVRYTGYIRKLKAIRLAEQLAQDSPDGVYRERMLALLREQDDELSAKIKEDVMALFTYTKNGELMANTRQQTLLIQELAETFDKVRALKGSEGAEDKADKLMNDMRQRLSEYKESDADKEEFRRQGKRSKQLEEKRNRVDETKKIEDDLLKSKKKFWKFTLNDGEEFQLVKSAISRQRELMGSNTRLNVDGGIDREALQEILSCYENLEENCRKYIDHINKKRGGVKDTGKERMDLVTRLYARVKMEKLSLEQTGLSVKARMLKEGSTWTDVLELARARKFSENEVEEVGAGTSIVYKIKNEDGTFSFAKAEETLGKNTMDDYLKDYEGMAVGWGAELMAHIRKMNREKLFITDEVWLKIAEEIKSVTGNKVLHGAELIHHVADNIRTYAENKFGQSKKNKKMRDAIYELADIIENYKPEEGLKTAGGKDVDAYAIKEDFFKYTSKRLLAYDMVHDSRNANIQGDEVVLSNRNVSMSRLAEDLAVGEVIAKSETAVMEKDGKLMRFNIMEGAKGISMGDMDDKIKEMKKQHGIDIQLEYTSEALNQLTKMQILDLIAGQIDRKTNNYFVEYFEDPQHPEVWKITNVKGIDNDLSFGSIPGQQVIDYGTGKAGALIDKKFNTTSIPFIEAEFWEQIQKYTKDAAIFSQADLRTEEEINFMWERFETVKNELEKLIEAGRLEVIPKAEIDEKGVQAMKDMMTKNREIDRSFAMHFPYSYFEQRYVV